MSNKATLIVFLAGIALAVIGGMIVYPMLPDQIASHWNAAGQVDDYMPKFWGVFLLPIVLAVMFLFYIIIPKIDPYRANIESFRKYYNLMWVVIAAFLFYVFKLMIIWNLGYRFDFALMMVPALAAFLYFLGWLLEKSKRNWFVGIRTPWTLSDDGVWEKTHQLGGKLFRAAAVFSLIGLFFRDSAIAIVVIAVPMGLVAIVTVVYSYFEYRKKNF